MKISDSARMALNRLRGVAEALTLVFDKVEPSNLGRLTWQRGRFLPLKWWMLVQTEDGVSVVYFAGPDTAPDQAQCCRGDLEIRGGSVAMCVDLRNSRCFEGL